jgi:hypothetical protein
MDYKYIKISHEGEKTIGIRTFSNSAADQAKEDYYPRKFEILQLGEMVAGSAPLNPANLEDGYYPIEDFKSIVFAADIVRDGEEIKAKPSRNYYEYVGAAGEG